MRNINFGRGLKFMHKQHRISMLLGNHCKGLMNTVQNLRNIQSGYPDDIPSDKILNKGGKGKFTQLARLKYKF
jgi:hypothetical protein